MKAKAHIRRKGKAPEDLRGLHIDIQPDGEVWTSCRTKEGEDILDIFQAFARFVQDNDLIDQLEEGIQRHLGTIKQDLGDGISFEVTVPEDVKEELWKLAEEAAKEDDEEEDPHEYMA